MKRYMVIMASVAILTTTAAFGQGQAVPTGVNQIGAYGYPANKGIQTPVVPQYAIDRTLSLIQTSGTVNAPLVLSRHQDRDGSHGYYGHPYYHHPYGHHHHGYYPYRHHYFHKGWRYNPYYPYRYYSPYRYHPYGYYYPYNYYYDQGNTWDFYPYYYYSW